MVHSRAEKYKFFLLNLCDQVAFGFFPVFVDQMEDHGHADVGQRHPLSHQPGLKNRRDFNLVLASFTSGLQPRLQYLNNPRSVKICFKMSGHGTFFVR